MNLSRSSQARNYLDNCVFHTCERFLPASMITTIEKFSIILVKILNPSVFSSSTANWMLSEVTGYQEQRENQNQLLSWISMEYFACSSNTAKYKLVIFQVSTVLKFLEEVLLK